MRRKGVVRTLTLAAFAVLASVPTAGVGPTVAEAAPITPEFAQSLYAQVGPLREADGCRLTRFDTSRFQITIGLVTANGTQHAFDLGASPAPATGSRTAGDWWLAVPPELARDCAATVAAIERVLGGTSTPAGQGQVGGLPLSAASHHAVLAWTFVLLLVGTVYVLARAAAACAAPWRAVAAFVLVWGVALGLRLTVSPRTFLHEYYHITETVGAYFGGEAAPGYGRTGPALFRLAAQMLGAGDDVRILFFTNAVLSSMAVPAVAMLVLAVFRSWPQALCAALLLAVSPQHLRFSAAEDLFVQAITFGLWALALFASHQRTRRQVDALLGALAASLAMQSRPEMIFFPLVVVGFLFGTERRAWRTVLSRPMLVAALVFAVSIVPHVLDVLASMRSGRSPSPGIPSFSRYVDTLVVLDPQITPTVHRVVIAVGAAWAAVRRPGWLLWILAVYVGFTVFALSIFDNPQFHLRAQNLPTSYLLMLGVGVVPAWMAAWGARRRVGAGVGIAVGVLSAVMVVAGWRGFIGELEDQQLEWAFLERHVPDLPRQATLLTAVEAGGHNLDVFPEFLLTRSGRRYALVDVRKAAKGAVPWPEPSKDLLFYQGMFCYFAFDDEPSPEPMTPVCRAVHERYDLEPLIVEDLRTEGYSSLRYAQGGRGVYRIGFYRLTPRP
jgi:hypothetical protein